MQNSPLAPVNTAPSAINGIATTQAARAGFNVYAAGIRTSEKGYAVEAPLWQSYAREHAMAVLIANHGGPSGGYVSARRSGIWDSSGKLVVEAPGVGRYLVVSSMDVDG